MTRPSRNTDRLLIQAGRELLPECGGAGLNLRQVADRAGVNLGMFHYHFKSKDEFLKRIFSEIYADFLVNLKSNVDWDSESEVIPALREALFNLLRFAAQNRSLIGVIFKDIISGNQVAIDFATENFHQHIGMMFKLIERGIQQKLIKPLPPPLIATFLGASLVGPMFMFDLVSRVPFHTNQKKFFTNMIESLITEEMVRTRIDMSLQAILVEPDVLTPKAPLKKRKLKNQIKKKEKGK